MCFAFCDTFLIKLSARRKQFRLQSTIFSISRERRCLESLFSRGFGESFQAPAFPLLLVTLAPDVECEKLCGYSCYSWHSTDALKLQTVSQVRHRSFFHALHHFSSSRIGGLESQALLPSLWGSLEECSPPRWAGKGWRTPGLGLPGLAATCNSQQLAPVNITAEAPEPHGKTRRRFVY